MVPVSWWKHRILNHGTFEAICNMSCVHVRSDLFCFDRMTATSYSVSCLLTITRFLETAAYTPSLMKHASLRTRALDYCVRIESTHPFSRRFRRSSRRSLRTRSPPSPHHRFGTLHIISRPKSLLWSSACGPLPLKLTLPTPSCRKLPVFHAVIVR